MKSNYISDFIRKVESEYDNNIDNIIIYYSNLETDENMSIFTCSFLSEIDEKTYKYTMNVSRSQVAVLIDELNILKQHLNNEIQIKEIR